MIHISKAALERKCAFASQTFTHVKMPQFFPDFPKEATAERDIPPPPPAFLQQPFQISELDRLLEGHTDRAGQQVPRQVRHRPRQCSRGRSHGHERCWLLTHIPGLCDGGSSVAQHSS